MKNTILLAALLLASSGAFAANAYVGINASSALQRVDVSIGTLSERTTGYKVYGGYKLSANVGVEGGYVNFGKVSESVGGTTATVEPSSFYVALTGAMPATDNIEVFVKLGVARSETKYSIQTATLRESEERTRIGAVAGIGFQYRFSDSLSAVGEYEYFAKVSSVDELGAKSKVSLISLGLRMAF